MLASKFTRSRMAQSINKPLTNDEIRSVCPSVFAEEPHSERSSRYTYVPTVKVLDGLRKNGFEVFSAVQAIPRKEDRLGFAKHMLRLRRVEEWNKNTPNVGGINEVILLNSHDGSSSYQLIAGHFRFVCSNGLMIGDKFGEIRVHHKGNIVDDVIDGCITVVKDFQHMDNDRELFRSITLNEEERKIFANAALQLRYEAGQSPITEERILRPRRTEDKSADLWTTMNVVQENIMRGGVLAVAKDGTRKRTREIKGIDQNIGLNRALWTLTDEMAKLKK